MQLIEKIELLDIDISKIKQEVYSIVGEYNLPQIGLTHTIQTTADIDKITESVGSIYDRENKKFKFKETDFVIFNEKYKDTELYKLYNTLGSVGRFRIMVMNGPSCYTIHKDLTKRYHLVIETNRDCIFLFPEIGQQLRIPDDGNLYLIDTRHRHTFVNGSRDRRIHLVIDDISTLDGN